MHPAEYPRYRRLLAIGQAGLGQVHRKHGNVAVQSLIHGPQVIQHPEIQGTAVIKAVGPEIHRRDLRQLAGIGLQHQIAGDLHQRAGQGTVRKALVGARLVPVKGVAVQCQLYIAQGQGIHIRRVTICLSQQQILRLLLDDPECLPCRLHLFGPGRGIILRPTGIAGAALSTAARQQAQAQDRRKQSLHGNRLLFISTSLSAQAAILFPVLQIFPEIIIFLKFVLDILLSPRKINIRLEV